MFTDMATSKQCSVCKKELGPIHCTGCDDYFCKKDFKIHCEGMYAEMDKIVEKRNNLHDEINNAGQDNNQKSTLIDQINQWQDTTIEKVKHVAAQARRETIQLLNSKRTKINPEFKSFSEELVHWKKTENYVEHDLARLNEMINKFKQDLRQTSQRTMIKLCTDQSDGVNWNRLIYVKEVINNEQRQPVRTSKLITYFS
jgi:DNA repair exonuclease SbcCD ATPase subunit